MEPISIAIALVFGVFGLLAPKAYNEGKYMISGKRIIILGAGGAGKTKFYTLLGMMKIDKGSPEATVSPERVQRCEIKITVGTNKKEQKTFLFKGDVDVPGNEKKYWKEPFEKADIILYLINADELLRNQDSKSQDMVTLKRVKEDFDDLNKWMEQQQSKVKKLFIVGNHYDKVDNNYNTKYNYYLQNFKELLGKMSKDYRPLATDIIIGSLETGGVNEIMGKIVDKF